MPSDVLLPLFALTLLANAVLVGVAIRGMRRGRGDLDRPLRTEPPARAGTPAPSAAPPERADVEARTAAAVGPGAAAADPLAASPVKAPLTAAPDSPAAPSPAAPPPAARPPVATISEVAAATTPEAAPAPTPVLDPPASRGPEPRRPGSPRPAAPTRQPAPDDSSGAAAKGRRGRRRFSLPPLDEDHEKVSRSIESFLGGVDGTAVDPTGAAPDASPAVASPTAGATTVAIVAIDGWPDSDRTAPVDRPTAAASDSDALDPVAMVERTLRGAARGSDTVNVDRAGRFQVVLAGTGELAARAYLRRIRATVEPMLEASGAPLRLVIATATALGTPIEDAVRVAEGRLTALLEAPVGRGAGRGPGGGRGRGNDGDAVRRPGPADDTPGPRAAGD